jgi:uncharacterized protein (TIGR02453 family)
MPTPSSSDRHFTPDLFRFMRDLAAHNDRDWFKANKDRYEREVREPALAFIVDFGQHLDRISPHFRADPRPHGGSLFRIHRDTRFSKDKSPYKNHTGIYFPHLDGKNAHTPGFYLNLQPRSNWVGVGLWRPDTPTLKKLRDRVAGDPDSWRAAVGNKAFRSTFRIQGDMLKRPPRGYDPEHPLVEVLKLKDFTAVAPLTQKQVTGGGFVTEFAGICRAGAPLVRWVCEAIGQPF